MRNAGLLLAAALSAGVILAADRPTGAVEGGPIAAAGIQTDAKGDTVTIWTDGEEQPATYVYADRFDRKTVKGIFNISRVPFTYAKDGDTRRLLTIKKEKPLARGTASGTVLFADDFWLVVKPRTGPADGYAPGAPPGHAGDNCRWVAHHIATTTDERP